VDGISEHPRYPPEGPKSPGTSNATLSSWVTQARPSVDRQLLCRLDQHPPDLGRRQLTSCCLCGRDARWMDGTGEASQQELTTNGVVSPSVATHHAAVERAHEGWSTTRRQPRDMQENKYGRRLMSPFVPCRVWFVCDRCARRCGVRPAAERASPIQLTRPSSGE
jgi:hypothetical protein